MVEDEGLSYDKESNLILQSNITILWTVIG